MQRPSLGQQVPIMRGDEMDLDLGAMGFSERLFVYLNEAASVNLVDDLRLGADMAGMSDPWIVGVAPKADGTGLGSVFVFTADEAARLPIGSVVDVHYHKASKVHSSFAVGITPVAPQLETAAEAKDFLAIEERNAQAIDGAAADMIRTLKEARHEVRTLLDRERKDLQRAEAGIAAGHYEPGHIEEYRIGRKIPHCERHLSEIDAKLKALADDPSSMFLPLGTIVRFREGGASINSLAILPDLDLSSYPASGSIGVVTGLSHDSQYAIPVSMRRTFADGRGDEWAPSHDRMPTFRCNIEQLEVIGFATYPDGTPCEDYCFVPTHERVAESWKAGEPEMILEADGFFWRLHDFGGTQSIEALQAYEDIAEMSWIAGPLPEFTTHAITESNEGPSP